MGGISEVVRAAAAGDLEAFAEIVRRFQDMACGYAYSILGDWHLAEDAAQEAFVEAYRSLPSLRTAEAFPGWFRRIVFKYCDRIRRKKGLDTVSLEAAAPSAAATPDPSERLHARELERGVLEAVQSLPERQREATTLYYINGYSQQEIADFLEEPVSTVKKRLHDSRRRLKERMVGMMSETLKQNAPDERFSQRVISRLLARPRPMEIKGHPVREVFESIRTGLPRYEYIEGEEVVAESEYFIVDPDHVYRPREGGVLRPELTLNLFDAIAGRTPPIRIYSAGRVFRSVEEDVSHLKVFNTVEALCIEEGITVDAMQSTVRRFLECAIGPCDLDWVPEDFPRFEHGMSASIQRHSRPVEVAGCGIMTGETLAECGLDPADFAGFGFGLGLERLAMLKYGIEDIRDLWKPPFVSGDSG